MPRIKDHRTLAFINIFILGILLFDTFIFEPTVTQEAFDHGLSERTRIAVGWGSYWTYFIYSKNGVKLQWPENQDMPLQTGDTFYLSKSQILQQPLSFVYSVKEGSYRINTGLLYHPVSKFFLIVAALISLYFLFFKPSLKHPNRDERWIFFASAIVGLTIFFYFYQ